jgi:phospholipid N-methyltransferase
MTTDEWKRKKMSDVPQSTTHAATDTHGAHRTRSTWGGNWKTVFVYLTDAKRIDPPTKQAPLTPTEPTAVETLATMAQDLKAQNPVPTPYTPRQRDERIPSHDELHEMKQTAAQGVVIVAVPQLFPTPPELAARMVALSEIRPGDTVLEPSAGTGVLLDAIRRNGADSVDLTAVEIDHGLTGIINKARRVHYGDFLECNGELGKFDRIVMNPPFVNAADIKHIIHALKMLKPGGRIVALCANGPRQNDVLKDLVAAHSGPMGGTATRYLQQLRNRRA